MLPVLSREVVEGKQRVAILDQALDSLVVFDAPGFDEGVERGECIVLGRGHPDLLECSSLYLILQTASFWRWPVHCRWGSGSDHFFPRNRDGVKECLQRRLGEAPAALMRSLLVVVFDP